ncbi:hypothetical protein J3Q64DRAFT_1728904 [Phycomyces blakesleeanus]|uniref:Secreted protein n=1 Tax=Phycomyces blakesleeanus TaxID=4837 RepID=A0ABR3B523_PHYBL
MPPPATPLPPLLLPLLPLLEALLASPFLPPSVLPSPWSWPTLPSKLFSRCVLAFLLLCTKHQTSLFPHSLIV